MLYNMYLNIFFVTQDSNVKFLLSLLRFQPSHKILHFYFGFVFLYFTFFKELSNLDPTVKENLGYDKIYAKTIKENISNKK